MQNNQVQKFFKNTATAMMLSMIMSVAMAEVLVILPETGAMANATDSIKRGLVQANLQANSPYQFKFVDHSNQSISDILKKNVNKSTQFIIGPLDKNAVYELLQSKVKVPVLALNKVEQTHPQVLQFALSKQEDAIALSSQMKQNGITEVLVLKENGNAQISSFYEEMLAIWGGKMQEKSKLPFLLNKKQGVLLLGSHQWLSQQKLPQKNIYTLAAAIEDNKRPPEGIVFCDTPALYTKKWNDVILAYKQNPVSMPYQRLIAFGGDAWQIMDSILKQNQQVKNNNKQDMVITDARTGKIHILFSQNQIQRLPQCFEYHQKGIKLLAN